MQQNPTSCIRNVGENPTCPFCSNRSIKYGSSKKGSQRFRCKSCCRSFLLDYSYLACKAGTNTSIKEHVKESCSQFIFFCPHRRQTCQMPGMSLWLEKQIPA